MYEYLIKDNEINIIDGDTIDCMIDQGFWTYRYERIRIVNINTPETRTKNKLEKEAGLIITEKTRRYFKDAKKIILTTFKEKGKFGRIIGDFYVDEKMISLSEYLLKNKFAKKYGIDWTENDYKFIIRRENEK